MKNGKYFKLKNISLALSIALVGIIFFVTQAMATEIPGSALQNVLNGITLNGDSSVDVTTDYVPDQFDSYWNITASGGSIATMIIELASFAPNNVFGVYSGDQYVTLFTGGDEPGAQVMLSIKVDGSVYVNNSDTGIDFASYSFGYFLDSSYYARGGLFHSDSTLNADGKDHMYAYQGTGDQVQLPGLLPGTWTSTEYVLAFEDLASDYSDWDFTDMVVMVESVEPVPEPATLILVGSGLLGLAGFVRRKVQSV